MNIHAESPALQAAAAVWSEVGQPRAHESALLHATGEAAYVDDLANLLGDRLVVHASDEGRRIDLDALFASLPQGALALFCGPMRMLDAARHAWIGAGHPLPDLRYETFGSSGTLPTETFRVRLKGSDIELEIPRERFVSEFDHPKLPRPNEQKTAEINRAAFDKLWPILTGDLSSELSS